MGQDVGGETGFVQIGAYGSEMADRDAVASQHEALSDPWMTANRTPVTRGEFSPLLPCAGSSPAAKAAFDPSLSL